MTRNNGFSTRLVVTKTTVHVHYVERFSAISKIRYRKLSFRGISRSCPKSRFIWRAGSSGIVPWIGTAKRSAYHSACKKFGVRRVNSLFSDQGFVKGK